MAIVWDEICSSVSIGPIYAILREVLRERNQYGFMGVNRKILVVTGSNIITLFSPLYLKVPLPLNSQSINTLPITPTAHVRVLSSEERARARQPQAPCKRTTAGSLLWLPPQATLLSRASAPPVPHPPPLPPPPGRPRLRRPARGALTPPRRRGGYRRREVLSGRR